VIKDDFGLETPLTFAYDGVGYYSASVASLGVTLGDRLFVSVSNQIIGISAVPSARQYVYSSFVNGTPLKLSVQTTQSDLLTLTNNVLDFDAGVVISIRETLEGT
jgi:hypothetical protein